MLFSVVSSNRMRSNGLKIKHKFYLNMRKSLLYIEVGKGCPERLWTLPVQHHSKPTWTPSCVTWCRWLCRGRWVGTGWSQEVPSNPKNFDSRMYDNIFCRISISAIAWLTDKIWEVCWQFWSPRRLNWKIFVQRGTTRLIRGMKSLFSGKE